MQFRSERCPVSTQMRRGYSLLQSEGSVIMAMSACFSEDPTFKPFGLSLLEVDNAAKCVCVMLHIWW